MVVLLKNPVSNPSCYTLLCGMSARHSDISNDCQTSEINFQSLEIIFDILHTVSMFSTWIDKDEIIISVTDVDATNFNYVLTP